MMTSFRLHLLRTSGRAAAFCAFALPVAAAWAQPSTSPPGCDPAPARAVSVQGTVETQRGGSQQWQSVKLNDTFCAGDSIRVGDKSRADVALLNQSVLRINANSAITVEA